MHFNMNRTWSQAVALVRANFQLLAIIAGVFLLLPALVLALAMPGTLDFAALGTDPEAAMAALGDAIMPLLAYSLVGLLLQFVGYGAMVALIGGDRPTVGEAIMLGIRCLLTILGALLVFLLAYAALALAVSLVIAGIAAALGAIGGGAISAVLTIVLMGMLLAAVLYVMARLSLTLPVVVLEGARNPLAALRRSWHLTRLHGGAIFGFYLLLMIAYFVISLLLFGLLGAVGAALGQGPGAALLTGLVNGLAGALVAMVMSGILVSMHQQLAGRTGRLIGETLR